MKLIQIFLFEKKFMKMTFETHLENLVQLIKFAFIIIFMHAKQSTMRSFINILIKS